MTILLAAAGRTFLKTFLIALLAFGVGLTTLVTKGASAHEVVLTGLAALLGVIAASLSALQVYVPDLTVSHYLKQPYGAWADAFLHAFLATLLVTLTGALQTPNLHTVPSLIIAAILGALNAGMRALEGLLTTGQLPFKWKGIKAPTVLTVDRQVPVVAPAAFPPGGVTVTTSTGTLGNSSSGTAPPTP